MEQNVRNPRQESPFIELGKIGKPHGVRGDLRLFLHNPSSDYVFSLESVYVGDGIATPQEYKIRSIKDGTRFLILTLKDVRGRENAQALNGLLAMVPREWLPELEDGEFYIADLIGTAVTCNGETLGQIIESREQGGIEVVTVANKHREIQIPVVDDYVVKMNVSEGNIEVRNISGLPVFEYAETGK